MLMLRSALWLTLCLVSSWGYAHHEVAQEAHLTDETADIVASRPWARATPPGAGAGGGYVTLTNRGDRDDRLVGARTPITERVEIHAMEMDGDIMRMVHLPEGIELPAGETVNLAPGGLHLMFMELTSPIAEGAPLPVTLDFQHAESLELHLRVVPPGARLEGEDHPRHSHHPHHEETHGHSGH